MSAMTSEPEKQNGASGWFAYGGLASGLGALIGASCCVLPLLLAQIGIGTALIAHLGAFAPARPFLIVITSLLVAAGLTAAFWGGRRPRPLVLVMLGVATLLIAVSILLPNFEPQLLKLLRT